MSVLSAAELKSWGKSSTKPSAEGLVQKFAQITSLEQTDGLERVAMESPPHRLGWRGWWEEKGVVCRHHGSQGVWPHLLRLFSDFGHLSKPPEKLHPTSPENRSDSPRKLATIRKLKSQLSCSVSKVETQQAPVLHSVCCSQPAE